MDDKNQKNYDRAITLIQNQVQLFWLVFGAFLVSETVLLAGIASLITGGSFVWGGMGALLGLFLCVPWWCSFKYNHAFYVLRIYEATKYEPECGTFFLNGERLRNGETLFSEKKDPVSIPWHACKPMEAISILIIAFAALFLFVAIASLFLFFFPYFQLFL